MLKKKSIIGCLSVVSLSMVFGAAIAAKPCNELKDKLMSKIDTFQCNVDGKNSVLNCTSSDPLSGMVKRKLEHSVGCTVTETEATCPCEASEETV